MIKKMNQKVSQRLHSNESISNILREFQENSTASNIEVYFKYFSSIFLTLISF